MQPLFTYFNLNPNKSIVWIFPEVFKTKGLVSSNSLPLINFPGQGSAEARNYANRLLICVCHWVHATQIMRLELINCHTPISARETVIVKIVLLQGFILNQGVYNRRFQTSNCVLTTSSVCIASPIWHPPADFSNKRWHIVTTLLSFYFTITCPVFS